MRSPQGTIHFADNLDVLRAMPSGSVELVYVDPPFNTGKRQTRRRLSVERSASGDRVGFGGVRYASTVLGTSSFADRFDDYLAFLEPRLVEARRVLAADGSLYFHVDYREVHYCKVLLDAIFGRASFLNEIVWAYDYGARTTRRWPPKHDNILWYAKDPARYVFDAAAVDRIPYMAPGLVGAEKAARGKLPTDTWWHTIVPTRGKERTGYPTQKPLGILRRIVAASSRPGATVLDFFAGSGTTGAAALELGRKFVLVDSNREALAVMARRFAGAPVRFVGYAPRARRALPASTGASARTESSARSAKAARAVRGSTTARGRTKAGARVEGAKAASSAAPRTRGLARGRADGRSSAPGAGSAAARATERRRRQKA